MVELSENNFRSLNLKFGNFLHALLQACVFVVHETCEVQNQLEIYMYLTCNSVQFHGFWTNPQSTGQSFFGCLTCSYF
ncbi:hypothetical protein P879_10654 [Paragonimus westermani]|uniref:Uncharacterized protein n=1 Tax=Paragonimus westermani TaxID=34504 RepID=A0A8T0DDZ7_9TREM|nr:hypothetical protein P879_10654 [Paragonimus westermani]